MKNDFQEAVDWLEANISDERNILKDARCDFENEEIGRRHIRSVRLAIETITRVDKTLAECYKRSEHLDYQMTAVGNFMSRENIAITVAACSVYETIIKMLEGTYE